MIRTGIVGALGKMGQEIVKAVTNCDDTELVMAVDVYKTGEDIGKIVLGKENNIIIGSDIEEEIEKNKPDVIIDFTQPNAIYEHVKLYMKKRVKSVIGTTGLKETEIEEIKKISEETKTACLIAPNFSTGAVLLMMFAKQAAKYFNNAEIIELHHNQKKDAPSGTAIKTAQMMSKVNQNFTTGNCPEKELLQGARGANATSSNIHIHSVRMPGYIASQEVIFGADGQIFKIKHDTMSRTCYMDGILLAVRHVYNHNEFIYGLDNIM